MGKMFSFAESDVNSALNYMMYELSGENRIMNFGSYDWENPPKKCVSATMVDAVKEIIAESSDGDVIILVYINVPEGHSTHFSVGYYVNPLAN